IAIRTPANLFRDSVGEGIRDPSLTSSQLRTLRTAIWHLRNGGLSQVRTWYRRRLISQRAAEAPTTISTSSLEGVDLAQIFPQLPAAERDPVFSSLRVGVILDEFSMECFGYEWNLIPLNRRAW